MTSKREAVEQEVQEKESLRNMTEGERQARLQELAGLMVSGEMTPQDHAEMLALLASDKGVAKTAEESYGVGFKKSATGERSQKESNRAIFERLLGEVNGMYAPTYNQHHQALSDLAAKASLKLSKVCEREGIEVKSVKWSVSDNDHDPTFRLTGASASTWNPQTYQANEDAKPKTKAAKALVKASQEFGKPATLATLKEKAGLLPKAKLGSTMTDFFTKTGQIARPSA